MAIYRLHSTEINYIITIKYTITHIIVAVHHYITNDKEEAVQLIYLSIDTKSRQQYCTSVVLYISEVIRSKIHCMIFQKQVM